MPRLRPRGSRFVRRYYNKGHHKTLTGGFYRNLGTGDDSLVPKVDLFRQGVEELDRGECKSAILTYEKRIRSHPGCVASMLNLGTAYLLYNNLELAADCYFKALKMDEDYDLTHYVLGNLYEERGHMDKAKASYRRAVVLSRYRHTNACYRLGFLYHRTGKRIIATQYFANFLTLESTGPRAEEVRALISRDISSILASPTACGN